MNFWGISHIQVIPKGHEIDKTPESWKYDKPHLAKTEREGVRVRLPGRVLRLC